MGWSTSSDARPAVRRVQGKAAFRFTAILMSALFGALITPQQAHARGMQKLTDDDMRHVSARGLADRFLQRVSLYASNGLGIEVLGDMASLLNPFGEAFAGLIDAETTFKDAVFNPAFPSMLVDKDGSVLIRLPATIGEISFRNIRIRGSNGASFGSVTIRNIDLTGTTIRIKQH
jgi:hypothetical protein